MADHLPLKLGTAKGSRPTRNKFPVTHINASLSFSEAKNSEANIQRSFIWNEVLVWPHSASNFQSCSIKFYVVSKSTNVVSMSKKQLSHLGQALWRGRIQTRRYVSHVLAISEADARGVGRLYGWLNFACFEYSVQTFFVCVMKHPLRPGICSTIPY